MQSISYIVVYFHHTVYTNLNAQLVTWLWRQYYLDMLDQERGR